MFTVNNRNTRKRSEKCLKLTIKTPERCQCQAIYRMSDKEKNCPTNTVRKFLQHC